MRPLNLASRPFRNERLPKVLLAAGSLMVLLLTLFHALAIIRLLPGRTSKLAHEVNTLEEEGRKLRADATRLRSTKPNPEDAARWAILKDLVDRRVFSWTRLLSILEESMPRGVRLASVSPKVERGIFLLELHAIARTSEDGYELMRALEERPELDAVTPRSRDENDQGVITFRYSMKYNPAASPPPTPEPAPTASPEAAPSEVPPPGEGSGEEP